MRSALTRTAQASLWALLASGCSARIPEGKLVCSDDADCPSGFECRADPRGEHCYKRGSDFSSMDAGNSVPEPDASDPGAAPEGGASPGGNLPRGLRVHSAHFGSLGGARGKGPYRVHSDGFEVHTACDSSGRACVTGRIGP